MVAVPNHFKEPESYALVLKDCDAHYRVLLKESDPRSKGPKFGVAPEPEPSDDNYGNAHCVHE